MSRFSRQKNAALAKSPFSTRLDKTSSARTAVLFGSSDGCLGMLIPVEERAYRRLALLQQILSTALESPLALNPREFRDIKGRRQYHIPKRGILDGTILWRFLNLPADVQDELTGAMNTSTDLVLENLHELDMITAFF